MSLIIKDVSYLQFREAKFVLRTKAGHSNQCDQVERVPDNGIIYGINRRSDLCVRSRYYHVIGGLPGDAMHDVLEGVLQYECKEMLKVFINEESYFRLDELNERIRDFDYGYYNDKNKPSPISVKTLNSNTNSLKQKAAQMWCLGRFLPLMIGNLIPQEDERWQLFNMLLEINDIVFSPIVSEDNIGVLEGLIEEHHETFLVLYPGRSVIPKMHYMVHYPSQMLSLGPMVRSWCMRYEAKHRYFKQLAGILGNFTNVAYSLAMRHQRLQCLKVDPLGTFCCEFLHKPVEIGTGKTVVAGDAEYFDAFCEKEPAVVDTDMFYEATYVVINGTKYKLNAVVFLGFNNDLPEFGTISKIIVFANQDIYFLVIKYTTLEYNEHYHAFEVRRELRPDNILIRQEMLATYMPVHSVKPYGGNVRYGALFVAPRFMIPDD